MLHLFRKDVRLPVQLQRAMAAEAEAAREARAKVILPQWLCYNELQVCFYDHSTRLLEKPQMMLHN